MEIDKIKRTFELTQEITNKNYVLIPVLAKKLRVSDIELMEFIEKNPKLFYTEPAYSYRKVVKKEYLHGWGKKPFKYIDHEKSKNLGLGIKNVYIKAEDNFRTQEWLDKTIKDTLKYLHITEADNYGHIQGYYIEEDKENKDDQYRKWLWRNTPEKIQWLKDNKYIGKGSFVYGGWGDSYTSNYQNVISLVAIEELRKYYGWTFNDFKPLSK